MAMALTGLELERERRDDTIVIRARGELDLQTAATLCAPLDAAIRTRHARVLVDLADVRFCDSTGLRVLIGLTREAKVHSTRLVLVVPPDSGVARVIALTGAAEFLPLAPDRAAGLRLLEPPVTA
jgi:anti-anti-sigma factor